MTFKQPLYQIDGFNAVIGRFQSRMQRKHDFLIVICNPLQRRQFTCANRFALHRLGYLHVYFFISFGCNKINFCVADLADCDIIAAAQQFEIYNIFNRMSAVAVAKSEQVIPQADVHDLIFTQCAQELPAFDVKSFDFIEKIGLQQRIDIGLNRVCTWLAPAAAVIEQPFTDQCVADGRD